MYGRGILDIRSCGACEDEPEAVLVENCFTNLVNFLYSPKHIPRLSFTSGSSMYSRTSPVNFSSCKHLAYVADDFVEKFMVSRKNSNHSDSALIGSPFFVRSAM